MKWIWIVLVLAVMTSGLSAVTRLASMDGQFWDIQDTSVWSQDSGGIATGGASYPFNGFGYLKMQVRSSGGSLLLGPRYLRGFGLAWDGAERLDSITPVLHGGIVVARSVFAPQNTNYLRYLDTFTNSSTEGRVVEVAWGGAAGAYDDGGRMAIATTSSGDRLIQPGDTFVTVMQNARNAANPIQGPSGHGPSAHVLGGRPDGVRTTVGDMYADPFATAWPGFDPAHIGYVFRLAVAPGQTVALMTFVAKGLSEVYDPRGGFPAVRPPGSLMEYRFEPVYTGPDARIPAAGTEIGKVTEIARRLVSEPDVRGLTPRQLGQVVNWRIAGGATDNPPLTVFEKTTDELQQGMTRGTVTSEDIVRDYLTRLTLYDRNGPEFRSMIALNPRAIADARALDEERRSGRVRSVFHGIPVVFKDNIDVLGLPTTGGSLALTDHRPRLDSRMAAGMRRAGAVLLGKANLDEFPFGDFGVSTVGGTVGNAYDPTLSTAGSSGGTATAVAASLATLGFGTDTCNSLSNPSSFAALATIRTTRGLTSRSGVQPLATYNDAVGPMAKSVREIAQVLDAVAGPDPEDPVTADAATHIDGSFAAKLDATSLRGARIGLLRQRFVGFTGEREVAMTMDRVAAELRTAGATVVDIAIPDLDAVYLAASGSDPGSLKAGWNGYLARGAAPGERVLTIEDLLSSGKLAPGSAARFRFALQPVPAGPALEAARRRFVASRENMRAVLTAAMEKERLDAILYPGNQARPHTHEGGQERYGSEPGTCEESAMTGLPQVTVPAGFMGGRHPIGVSLLGRMWADARLLQIAFAYEQATRHRKPPSTVR